MFSTRRRGQFYTLTSAILTVLWLSGCGGTNSTGSGEVGNDLAAVRTGSLSVNIKWPEDATRLIPANTVGLKIDVNGNSPGLTDAEAQIITNGTSFARFPGLLAGTYTVAAGAYPDANAVGTLLAAAMNGNVVVTENNTTTVNLDLASQVVSVTVALNPTSTVDLESATSRATLTAWTEPNGNGSMVPIHPSMVTWVSNTPSVATVPNTAGNGVLVTPVTGSVPGAQVAVEITGTYRELPVDQSDAAILTVRSNTTTPAVISTVPVDGASGVSPDANITATFSRAMNPGTIPGAFTLRQGLNTVPGQVSYSGNTATFDPTGDLASDASFTATITTAAEDTLGNPLASDFVWTFSTHLGPAQPPLGAASAFSILAGSAVTNTDIVSNPTRIEGLVGVFPGSAVSGLPNAVVPASQIHAGDTVAQEGKLALQAAYDDALAASTDAISLPGNLGGLTLAPGLYVNGSSSGISGAGPQGILTLNAQGDSNAVWIFKMASTLITDPGTSIVLAGGAQAGNIYWQVGSSATLGTSSVFKGNILADVSITINTAANLEGRALTQTGAVTLDTNVITQP